MARGPGFNVRRGRVPLAAAAGVITGTASAAGAGAATAAGAQVTPGGAIVRGQVSDGTGWQNNSTSVVTNWAVNPTAGQTVLFYIQIDVALSSVVDNGTTPRTFTEDAGTFLAHGAHVYRAENITLPSAGQYKITATCASGTHTLVAQGVAYSGIAPGGPVATNTGSATSVNVSTGAVTGPAGGLYFGGFSDKSGLNPETITFNSGATYTEFNRNTNGASLWPGAAADAIIAGGGSSSISWTLGDSVIWGAAIAVYAPAAGNVLPDLAMATRIAP